MSGSNLLLSLVCSSRMKTVMRRWCLMGASTLGWAICACRGCQGQMGGLHRSMGRMLFLSSAESNWITRMETIADSGRMDLIIFPIITRNLVLTELPRKGIQVDSSSSTTHPTIVDSLAERQVLFSLTKRPSWSTESLTSAMPTLSTISSLSASRIPTFSWDHILSSSMISKGSTTLESPAFST